MTKGSDAPKERSARQRPLPAHIQAAKSHNGTARRQGGGAAPSADPRFSPFVHHGTAVKQNVERQYSFLAEVAAADEERRRGRLRALRQEQRIRERERERPSSSSAAAASNNDAADDEGGGGADDDDDEDEDDALQALPDDERIRIGLMRDRDLDDEIYELKQKSNAFKMKQGERRVEQRHAEARRSWAQKQFTAVKSGQQKQPYFLNERRMNQQVVRENLKQIALKGGKQGETAYVEKQLKRRFGVRHLQR